MLVNAYQVPEAKVILYHLLKQRLPEENISHKQMPTWEQHVAFFEGRPYEAWYIIFHESGTHAVGAIYLTRAREVGIGILKAYRGKGYGKGALAELRALHPGPLLANISHLNTVSQAFFRDQGFQPLQVTYALNAS